WIVPCLSFATTSWGSSTTTTEASAPKTILVGTPGSFRAFRCGCPIGTLVRGGRSYLSTAGADAPERSCTVPGTVTLAAAQPTDASGLEVLESNWLGWPWGSILDASLDRPTVGTHDAPAVELAGWVVGRDAPVTAIRILVAPFPPDGMRIVETPVAV